MGKQYNKVIKARRRKSYLKRKEARLKVEIAEKRKSKGKAKA